mmetsp:Transcript_25051/g.64690  ORF Transcript_25051/g.64690 Transcript_25051/m.64690 type:complete len:230 (+) Transcript_25051:566-1255(+)
MQAPPTAATGQCATLGHPPGKVDLASLLGIPLSNAAVVIATTPGVLGSRPSRLAEKWKLMCRLASMHVPWALQVAEWKEPLVGRILTVRREALDRPRYILRHGMQGLPQAQNFKRLLTMSNRYFYRHFVAPYPARTIYGRIKRFPERPPKQAPEDNSSSSSSRAAGYAGSSHHKDDEVDSNANKGSLVSSHPLPSAAIGSGSSGRNKPRAGESTEVAETTNGRAGAAAL